MSFFSLVLAGVISLGPLLLEGAPCAPVALEVQGSVLHCCTVPNGQRCCAQGLDANGKVLGCGC